MGLSLLNIGLLAGAALAAVPIILHLVMRQKPKHLLFPALRLIRLREHANRRKLRLRHILLLALRVALVVLMALALARPVVRSAGIVRDQESPVAAALLFDTSLSMQYRYENQTRLERAQTIAMDLLPRLPERSEVAVFDSAGGAAFFQIDRAAVRGRIESLEPTAASRPVLDGLAEALKLLQTASPMRRELYVFSDLAQNAWQGRTTEIQTMLAQVENLVVYVLDVGVAPPTNGFISAVVPSAQVLPRNSELRLRVAVEAIGATGQRTVELHLDDGQNHDLEEKRGQQPVDLKPGEAAEVVFSLSGLAGPVHQGYVQLVGGGDPLPFDDVRYFTLEVRPAMRLLVVADGSDAVYWIEALAPQELRNQQRAHYVLDQIRAGQLGSKILDPYAAVCLVNVSQLPADAWARLGDYVTAGGGLVVLAGPNVNADAYNSPAAQNVLPGRIGEKVEPLRPVNLNLGDFSHPILSWFREEEGGDLPFLPVYRYFSAAADQPGAAVVIAYNDGRPALIERALGRGRVLVLTTSVSYNPDGTGWNDLPSNWSFLALADQMMLYLSGGTGEKLNYESGQTVALRLDPASRLTDYTLVHPAGVEQRRSTDPSPTSLVVGDTSLVGHYRIHAGPNEGGLEKGFSVNPPPEESSLTPVDSAYLDGVFGKEQYHLVDDSTSLERVVGEARVGREVFPLIALLLVVILAVEQWLANRFYRDAPEVQPAAAARAG
jgi:hypothetical protein